MGVVAFNWGENGSITLIQNRDNYESMVINRAAWIEAGEEILCGALKTNGGTWCGCSKTGRIAFLAERMPFDSNSRSELLTTAFLKSTLSPEEFAARIAAEEVMYRGLSFHLVVATPRSNSMFYIGKASVDDPAITVNAVGFGVHVLSPKGLDAPKKYDEMKRKFSQNFGDVDNAKLGEFAEMFRSGPDVNPYFKDLRNAPKETRPAVQTRFGTTSTTALTVLPAGGQVHFYEKHLLNDEWKDNTFNFVI